MNVDDICAEVDSELECYVGDPMTTPLDPETPVKAIAAVVDVYRTLGWTVEHASDPVRLILC
jgi:hypothetical protein